MNQKKLQINLLVIKKGLYICSRLEKQRSQQQVEKKKSQVGLYIERFESFNFHNIHYSLPFGKMPERADGIRSLIY